MASTGSVSMKRMATAGECTTVYLVGPSTHDDVQAFAEQASCRKQFVHCVPRPVQKVVDRCIHSRSAHILMVALPAPIGCTQAARVGHDTEVNATRVRQLSKEPWTFADVVSECPGSCGFDPPNCGRTDSPQSPGNPRSRKAPTERKLEAPRVRPSNCPDVVWTIGGNSNGLEERRGRRTWTNGSRDSPWPAAVLGLKRGSDLLAPYSGGQAIGA